VSHDREFVNNVVTSTLVFEGDAQVNEYVGGYDDWLQQSKNITRATADAAKVVAEEKQKTTTVKAEKPKKLSYKEQRELDTLPAQIESYEEEVESLQQLMASDEFYKQEKEKIIEVQKQLEKTQASLAHCYTRWEELEP
jgi:ATP-binding cassette subfamily F protein uup